MALPDQIAAYPDCEDVYAKATATEKGARAAFPDYAAASLFRLRMNHYRVLLRRQSVQVYESDDPRCGKSEYDHLVCRLRAAAEPGQWWVYCEPHGQQILALENIEDDEPEAAE